MSYHVGALALYVFFWGVIVARYMHAQIGESLRCDFHGDDSKIDYWLQVTVRMSKQLQDTIAITMLNVTQFSLKRMVVQWEMLICLFSPISVLCFLECSMPTPGTAASFHAPFWFAVPLQVVQLISTRWLKNIDFWWVLNILPETNIFEPENGWLEYGCFLFGFRPLFRCENVSFRECIS